MLFLRIDWQQFYQLIVVSSGLRLLRLVPGIGSWAIMMSAEKWL